MMSGAKPAVAAAPLRVLLVGAQEENYFLIHEILERNRSTLVAQLDHAHSLHEARTMLRAKSYGLVLFEHEAGDVNGVKLLNELLQAGTSVPFLVLTEGADEKAVAEVIESRQWNYLVKSQIDGATLIRSIRGALEMHAMRQGQQLAEASIRKLSRAVEQSPDAVVVTDRKGTIEYVNPAFEALTGFSSAEACGKTPRILKSGEQTAEVYEELWRTILSGKVYRGIFVNRKKDGGTYHVEESISPVRDSDGQITHFIANGRDLTERVRLEAQLTQAAKMDAIGRLAGGVAHDFNNLLTIIASYTELALDDAPERSPLQTKLKEVLKAARRAAELTRKLLAFSRKQPQALRVTDLNEAIASIAKTLPRLIGEDIEFSFTAGRGLGRVRVDPVQIDQIVMNLAANARDAMPEGGHFQIETSNVFLGDDYVGRKTAQIPKGRYALITISDNGPGVPHEHLPHLFEPFFTTKPPGEGTGLGLATVYGIVKQNGGYVWVYSELGMGTVFKIYLPCVTEQNCSADEDDGLLQQAPRGSETVLLVEDESAVRNAAAEFLRMQGYRVMEAKDGLDALENLRRHDGEIHLVVSDVVMPNMSGGQLAKELAQISPRTSLLFVSGYAGKTVLDHKVVDLETNFLQKPYTLKQFAIKVRDALDRRTSAPA